MQELPIHYSEVEAIYNQTIGAGYKTLAITSAKAGEGKTTIAQAIVERAHVVGKKVLLVEMNTFNPAISEKLRLTMSNNFDNNQIIKVENKGYSILPAPKDIHDVLLYREMSLLNDAVNNWLDDYNCIIFDTSALTTLNQSNIPADVICQVCEGTLLITEAGKTPASLIQESIDKLKLKKVNIVGTVINDKSNPSLLSELHRETYRFDNIFPKLMPKFRKQLSAMVVLNVSV